MTALLEGLNRVDYIFIVILAVCGLMGLFRGGMREIVSLISWFAGLVIALTFSQPLAKLFSSMAGYAHLADSASRTLGVDAAGPVSVFAVGVSFIVLFFATVLIGSLVGRALNGLVEASGANLFNGLLGICFGLGRGWLIGLVLIFVAQMTPAASSENWQTSKMVEMYQPSVDFFSKLVGPGFKNLKKQVTEGSGGAPVSSL